MTLEPQESSLQRKLSIACKPNVGMSIRCDTAEKRLPVSVRLQCQQPVDGHSEKQNCRVWVGGSVHGGKRKAYAVLAEGGLFQVRRLSQENRLRLLCIKDVQRRFAYFIAPAA
jgi:hypothetical protein